VIPPKPKSKHVKQGSLNVRVPVEFLGWLNLEAAEQECTVADVVRGCIALAIYRAGYADQFGVEIVDEALADAGWDADWDDQEQDAK
jgi:hypothetical protein